MIIFEIHIINRKIETQKGGLLIGSILPDLIDKPLSIFVDGLEGRGLGHAPTVLLLICLVIYFFERFIAKRKEKQNIVLKAVFSRSLLIGSFIHLLLDLPYIPWGYPFISYNFVSPDNPIQHWWLVLLNDPLIISTEIIGLIGIIGIAYKNEIIFNGKLFNPSALRDYLFQRTILLPI